MTTEAQQGLDAAQLQALKILGKRSEQTRDELKDGETHNVDMLVRVRGSLTVGNSSTGTTKSKPNAELVLASILQLVEHEPAIMAMVTNHLALFAGMGPEMSSDIEEGYIARARQLIERLASTSPSNRRGAVKGSFQVGLVDVDSVSASVSRDIENHSRRIVVDG